MSLAPDVFQAKVLFARRMMAIHPTCRGLLAPDANPSPTLDEDIKIEELLIFPIRLRGSEECSPMQKRHKVGQKYSVTDFRFTVTYLLDGPATWLDALIVAR